MIAYVFSEEELKFLCGKLDVRGIAFHQIKDMSLSNEECLKASYSLCQKRFIHDRKEKIVLNSGVAFLIETLGRADRLMIGKDDRIFTAYIDKDISVLLINDINSANYLMYPFENENSLVEWLRENGIFSWRDIRLEDEVIG